MLPKRFCVNYGKNIILFERHISSECLTIIVSWLDENQMLCVLCYHRYSCNSRKTWHTCIAYKHLLNIFQFSPCFQLPFNRTRTRDGRAHYKPENVQEINVGYWITITKLERRITRPKLSMF